ncbi:MAG: PAS domain S-box protein [Candidatus Accumulibacter sp.]|nr:PAS domain S-box protein [Accumulibacter sp.]
MINRPKTMVANDARALCRRLLHRAALLVVALLLPVFSVPVQAEQRAVRVGVGSNPPIAFRDSSGEMRGIAVDVLNHVAQQEDWRLEYVHDEWQAIVGMLERGEIDLLTGIAYTPERAERFQFTRQTLLSNWGVVYAKPGSRIQSLLALQEKRVALVPGTTHSDELSERVEKFGVRIVPVPAEDYDQVLARVAAGNADAGVVSRSFGTLHSAAYELESTGIVFNPISVRYAASPDADPAIVAALDRQLGALLGRPDTVYYRSLDRWLGTGQAATLPGWVAWALIGTAVTLSLAVFFVFLLRRRVSLRTSALRESEESFRATFEQAAVGIAQVAPDGSWLEVNQRLCDIVGYSREEMLKLSFQDITHPDDLATDLQLVGEVLAASRKTYNLEKRYLHKSGAIVWIRLTVALLRAQDGAPKYFVAVIEDITDRKLAEAALRESEERQRMFIDHAPAALAMFDRQMRYVSVSRRWLADYGLEDCEIVGRSHYEIFPEITETWKDVHRRAMAGEVVRADEERFERYDGTVQWLRWEVRPWHAADGSVGGIVIFSEDFTARRLAEASLREQEQFFRLIAENMGDMVTVLDLEGRRLYSSPACRVLFGEQAALQGSDAFASIHPDDRERVRRGFRDTIDTGVGRRGSFRVELADGSCRDIETQDGVIRGADGRVERVVVVSRDVTEHKNMVDEIRRLNIELEERVRRRTAELAAANKAMRTFTYSVSHDLKAPLRGIDGYSQLLLESYHDLLDEEGRLFLHNVRTGIAQMSRLIEDLLTYSRMERRSLHSQALDLSHQVALVLADRRADIEASGTVVDLALQGLTAHGDPQGLTMILRNLVDNALKFSRDSRPPTLTISATHSEQSVLLALQDNGIGFDMQFHDRIFEIFQRLQRAEDYPGTGVGLAIVHKAVQRMGGRVWGESAPGQGAIFYLELPR